MKEYIYSSVFIGKNLHVRGPMQFKAMLFKGQVYTKLEHPIFFKAEEGPSDAG